MVVRRGQQGQQARAAILAMTKAASALAKQRERYTKVVKILVNTKSAVQEAIFALPELGGTGPAQGAGGA